jgi:hypothetical protein
VGVRARPHWSTQPAERAEFGRSLAFATRGGDEAERPLLCQPPLSNGSGRSLVVSPFKADSGPFPYLSSFISPVRVDSFYKALLMSSSRPTAMSRGTLAPPTQHTLVFLFAGSVWPCRCPADYHPFLLQPLALERYPLYQQLSLSYLHSIRSAAHTHTGACIYLLFGNGRDFCQYTNLFAGFMYLEVL